MKADTLFTIIYQMYPTLRSAMVQLDLSTTTCSFEHTLPKSSLKTWLSIDPKACTNTMSTHMCGTIVLPLSHLPIACATILFSRQGAGCKHVFRSILRSNARRYLAMPSIKPLKRVGARAARFLLLQRTSFQFGLEERAYSYQA